MSVRAWVGKRSGGRIGGEDTGGEEEWGGVRLRIGPRSRGERKVTPHGVTRLPPQFKTLFTTALYSLDPTGPDYRLDPKSTPSLPLPPLARARGCLGPAAVWLPGLLRSFQTNF